MFKFIALLTICAAATAVVIPGTTPLLGKLIPQPALAPANTEHAGYVSGLTPLLTRQLISYQSSIPAVYPSVYTGEQIPLTYANNYVAYSGPVEASSYRIAY